MHILAIRPAPAGAGGRTIAHFDAQITPEIRIYDLRLVRTPDGRFLTYAPNSHGVRVATFAPELTDEITRAASAAYREGSALHASPNRAA